LWRANEHHNMQLYFGAQMRERRSTRLLLQTLQRSSLEKAQNYGSITR
jgi:hypothetical protein